MRYFDDAPKFNIAPNVDDVANVDDALDPSEAQGSGDAPNFATGANVAPKASITPNGAAMVRVGGEFLVNTGTNGQQTQPTITSLASGGFLVSWTDASADGSSTGIKAQIFNAAGAKVGSDFLVNTVTAGRQYQPTITSLASGGFAVSWTDGSLQGVDTSSSGIKAQIFDAAGAKVGAEFLVNTATLNNRSQPTITSLASGGFVVSWTDGSGQGGDSGFGIKAQVFDAAGAKVGAEFLVNTVTLNTQQQPTITSLASGGFVVSWVDGSGQGGDTSSSGIKAQLFDAGGVKVGAEFLVNTATAGAQTAPTIASLAAGGFVVGWTDGSQTTGDTSGNAVRAQIFDTAGAKVGGEFVVNTTTFLNQTAPRITSLASGGFAVSWTDDSGQGGDNSSTAIRAQVFDATGGKVGAEFLVNTQTANQQNASTITSLASGGMVVSWFDASGVGDADGGIKAQLYAPAMFQATEQTALDLKGSLAVSDADAGTGAVTATLSTNYGVLSVAAGTSGAAVANNGTGTVTLTGTIAQINALLSTDATSAVAYTANTDGPPATATLTLSVNDNGNTGGGTLTGSDSKTIAIAAVNDAPVIANLQGDLATFTEGDPFARVDVGMNAILTDADSANFNGGSLTATISSGFVAGFDRLGVLNSRAEIGLPNAQGFDFYVDGQRIGTISGYSGADTANQGFTITFDSDAAIPDRVQAIVQALFFDQVGDDAVGGTRGITVTLVDGDGTAIGGADTSSYTTSVNVIAVNDAPAGGDKTLALNEDGFKTLAASDFGFVDPEGNSLQAVKITTLPGAGTLYLDTDGAGTGGLGTPVTANQFVSAVDIDAGRLVFVPAANGNGTGYAAFTFQVQDNGGTANGGVDLDQSPNTLTFDVAAVNDAPTATITPNASVKIGAEFLVNTTTSSAQNMPTITSLASGRFVVSWADSSGQDGDASGFGIKAQIFEGAGLKVGGEFLVNTATLGSQSQPTITSLASGGFVVSWSDENGDVSGFGVKAQIYDAAGVKVGVEFLVNTTTLDTQQQPTITSLASGGFAVSWIDLSGQGGDTSSYGIKAQIFDAAGVKVGAEFLVNTATLNLQYQPTIASLASGGFVVSWSDLSGQGGDADGYSIKAQIFDAAGAKVGAEFLANTATLNAQSAPTITSLASGGFVVGWSDGSQTTGDTSGTAIRAQIFDAAGAKVGTEFVVNTTTSSNQLAPKITAFASGGFAVSWTDNSGQGGDASGSGIKAQMFDATGGKIGAEFLVNTATQNAQSTPTIASLASGGFVVSWTDGSLQGGDANGTGIKAQLFAPGFVATEQTAINLKGSLAVADVDAGAGIVTATLSATYGVLTVGAGDSGATVAGSGTGSVTLTGTIAQINALFSTDPFSVVAYTANTDAPPATATLTLAVDDGGNTGAGGALTGSDSENIYIASVNDAPSGTNNSAAVLDNATRTFTVADFGFTDVDGNAFASVRIATLPMTGTLYLRESIFDDGSQPVAAGADISVQEIANGNLFFQPGQGTGNTAPFFTFQVRDDGGTANGGVDLDQSPNTFTLNVGQSNRAPVVDLNADTAGVDDTGSYTEGAGSGRGVVIGSNIRVGDADGDQIRGATITITDPSALDGLQVDPFGDDLPTGITFARNSTGTIVYLTGTASAADYQTALRLIRFTNDGDDPTAGGGNPDRIITVTVNDGTVDSAPATLTLTVVAVNDTPLNYVPGSQTGREDTNLVFSTAGGNAITVVDRDSGTASITTTVHVEHGTLTLAGGSFNVGVTGNGTDTLTLTGTDKDITAQLDNLAYRGALNYNGQDSLTITTDDDGNTGTGGALTRSETVAITLVPDDAITGSAGDDTLTGTPQSDYFDLSQGGDDTATGLESGDAFYFGAALTAADRIDGGAGMDQVGISGDSYGNLVLAPTTLTNVEVLAVLPGYSYGITTDDATVAAGQVFTVFAGNLGLDDGIRFDGSAETDGSFRVYGGMGDDRLIGGAGDDGFYFGPGKFNPGRDRVDGGGGTNDQLALDGDYTITLSGRSIKNVEVIALLDGRPDVHNSYTISTDDSLLTGGATMTIYGAQLFNGFTFNGSAETDGRFVVFGGMGGDTIGGGAGDDVIYGGLGADTLTGGSGHNTYRYDAVGESTAAGRDVIADFKTGDLFDLSRMDAIAGTPGDDVFSFIGSDDFHKVAGELRFGQINGTTFVEGDVDGDGVSDFSVQVNLVDGHVITQADFVL